LREASDGSRRNDSAVPAAKRLTPVCLTVSCPSSRYAAQEIEGVLRHLFNGGRFIESPCWADESTLRRWWKEFRHKLLQWAGLLEAWIIQLSQQVYPSPNCFDPFKRLEESLSQLAFLPSEWTVMVKTLWWLSISHPL